MSNKQHFSHRKSKKIKLIDEKEKNIIYQDHNYPHTTTNFNWIDHGVMVDDLRIEQLNVTVQLHSGNHNKMNGKISQLAPILAEHDYSFANLNGKGSNSITLRQDLFPVKAEQENQNMLIVPVEDMSQTSLTKSVNTSGVEFIFPKNHLSKPETVTNCNRKLKANIIFENKNVKLNISDCRKSSIIDLTDDSKVLEQSASSKYPVVLKKVDSKEVPLEVKEARSLLKCNTTVNCKINQVVLNHAIPLPKTDPPLLKMVEPEKVTNSIKEALSSTKTTKNMVVLNHGLKERTRMPIVRRESDLSNEVNSKQIFKQKRKNQIHNKLTTNKNSPKNIEEQCAGKSNSEQLKSKAGKILDTYLSTPTIKSQSPKTPIILRKVDSNQVPDQIKKIVPHMKINNVSNLQSSVSKVTISSNFNEMQKPDISEVRLSSLANASQVSTVGSTTETSTVLGYDIMKPSTSNNIGVKNNDAVKVMSTENLVDLTTNLSDDEDDNPEELGLNSLEELQEFWEFLVELHDYNKQVIRSQQNRKRRYLIRIKKLEQQLKQDLGLKFEDEKNYESSELPKKEIVPSIDSPQVVVKKENHPMEE